MTASHFRALAAIIKCATACIFNEQGIDLFTPPWRKFGKMLSRQKISISLKAETRTECDMFLKVFTDAVVRSWEGCRGCMMFDVLCPEVDKHVVRFIGTECWRRSFQSPIENCIAGAIFRQTIQCPVQGKGQPRRFKVETKVPSPLKCRLVFRSKSFTKRTKLF